MDRIEFNTKVAIFLYENILLELLEFSLLGGMYTSDCGSCAMTGFEVMIVVMLRGENMLLRMSVVCSNIGQGRLFCFDFFFARIVKR